MKFILQNLAIPFDFQVELMNAKVYWDWKNKGKSIGEQTEIEIYREWRVFPKKDLETLCPVGSTQFVEEWLELRHGKKPSPINVPKELRDLGYVTRVVGDYNLPEDLGALGKGEKDIEVFVKSSEINKYEKNGFYKLGDSKLDTLNGKFQISEKLEGIIGEYRIFVYKGQALDIKCYSGDPWGTLPDKEWITDLINDYEKKGSPVSYTLDVATFDNPYYGKGCEVIEVHDFYSCGLYGFSDYEKLPFMLWRWFYEFTNKK